MWTMSSAALRALRICSPCRPFWSSGSMALPPNATRAIFGLIGLLELLENVLESGRADLLELVADAEDGLGDLDDPGDVDRRRADDEVAVDGLDRLGQLAGLLVAVAHGRQDHVEAVVLLEGLLDRADGEGPGVDDLGRAVLPGRDDAGAVLHAAVGQGRAVLDDEDALAADPFAVLDDGRGVGPDDLGLGVDLLGVGENRVDAFLRGRVHLVDDDDVGPAEVRLAGIVGELVPGPVRVGDDDLEVRLVERKVVVAAVPKDDVGFLLGLLEDGAVVDAGVDDDALVDVGLVLFALLDRRLVLVEVGVGGEALDRLLGQIAIGHGVPDGGHAAAFLLKDGGDAAAGLALAGTGPDGANGDDGPAALDHRGAGAEQDEVGPGGLGPGGHVHDVLVGQVAVGEVDVVDLVCGDESLHLGLGLDGDALGIELAGEDRGILAAGDVRDLRGRDSDHPIVGIVTEIGVEIVEVAPRGAEDQDLFHARSPFSLSKNFTIREFR